MSAFNNNSNLPEGSVGPHSSRAANAADPRVDSDLDSSRRTHNTNTHGSTGPTGTTGTSGLGSSHHTTAGAGVGHPSSGVGGLSDGPAPNTSGPHKSDLLNKADPRVDADRSAVHGTTGSSALGSNTHGTHGTTGSSALGSNTHGTHGTTGGGVLGSNTHGTTGSSALGSNTHGTHGTTGSNTLGSSHNSSLPEGSVGPHSGRAANAADPRVDSDLDSTRRAHHPTTTTGTHTGTTGSHTSPTTGTHASHTTGTHSAGTGVHGASPTTSTGPAPNTAGPHKSDLLNKIDPRVDSNLDGSKTVGGNKTFENN